MKGPHPIPLFWLWLPLCLGLCALPPATSAQSLKYTENRTPPTLNPLYADDMYSVRMTELIFESMIGWDKDQKPTPMLATSWTMASDKRAITLNLRKGVKWHDGKSFSSKDVEFTIKAMTSRTSQITDRYLAEIIQKVTTPDAHTVKIAFKKPLNKPLKWLQFKIIPAHRFKGRLPKRTDYFSQKPYGTGPFRFRTWNGRRVRLQRFRQHWKGKQIHLKKLTLQAIPDKNIQVEVLRYGGLDAIVRARPKDIPLFEKAQNIRLYPYSTNDWWYIGLNHKRGSPLRKRAMREALIYALDRESLRSAHLGDGQIISGPFSPNDPLYNFNVENRNQKIQKTTQMLDALGWKKRSGKPYRIKGSKVLRFRFLVPRSRSSYKPLCLALQAAWRRVGVKIDLVWLQDAAWSKAVFKQKKFDMVLHIWNFDELASIYPLFHSKGSRNYINYKNKEIDRLLLQATKTTDPVIYKAIYGKLHKLIHRDLPYLFLWSLTNYSAISSSIKQVTVHPFNYFHYIAQWRKKQ